AVEVAVSKFALGAWIVLILIPALIVIMRAIRQHYARLECDMSPETPIERAKVRPRVIVPVARLNVPAKQALAFAGAIAVKGTLTAVHVSESGDSWRRFRDEWERWPHEDDVELVVIESPFRSLSGPLLSHIHIVARANPEDTIVVVLPELIPRRRWEHLLHNQTALRL